MGLEQVTPGRYEASIVDWGIRCVPKLDDAIEAWVQFEFQDQAGDSQTITWKSLVLKKDGDRNKKTFTSLAACGLVDDDMIRFTSAPDALDKSVNVDITIVDNPSADGSKVYKNVEWINALGQGGGGANIEKPQGDDLSAIQQRLAAMGMGKLARPAGKGAASAKTAPAKKPPVRNHAPTGRQAHSRFGPEPSFDNNSDEIPF